MHGEADAIQVLEQTVSLISSIFIFGMLIANLFINIKWLFLNSSISEGLPLALGEAALTGAPIVCTDVGASLRVLTDPNTKERYSGVVAPNDADAMARAQINLLAMLGEWYVYADPDTSPTASSSTYSGHENSDSQNVVSSLEALAPEENSLTKLPENPTIAEVEMITRRMYEQTAARRRLGMQASAIVQKSFKGDRYLREHEQMLWIGKAKKDMRRAAASERRLPNNRLPCALDISTQVASGTAKNTKVAFRTSVSISDNSSAERRTGRLSESTNGSRLATECLPSLAFGTSTEAGSFSIESASSIQKKSAIPGSQGIEIPQKALLNISRLVEEETDMFLSR